LRKWEPYKRIWDVDKNLVAEKYVIMEWEGVDWEADLAQFDDLGKAAHQEASSSVVYFSFVNCTQLKVNKKWSPLCDQGNRIFSRKTVVTKGRQNEAESK